MPIFPRTTIVQKIKYSKYLVKHTVALPNQSQTIPFHPHILYIHISRLEPQCATSHLPNGPCSLYPTAFAPALFSSWDVNIYV